MSHHSSSQILFFHSHYRVTYFQRHYPISAFTNGGNTMLNVAVAQIVLFLALLTAHFNDSDSYLQNTHALVKPPQSGGLVSRTKAIEKDLYTIDGNLRDEPDVSTNALNDLADSVRRHPFHVDVVVNLANLQRELGNHNDCVNTLKELMKLAVRHPSKLSFSDGNPLPKEASQYLPAIIQSFSVFYYNKGTPEDDRRCVALSNAAILAYPDHPFAYNMLAAVEAANKRYAESLGFLLKAKDRAPEDPIVLMNIGEMHLLLKQNGKAAEAFNAIIKSNAEDHYKNLAVQKLKTIEK